ncbi:MAG: OmpA family protein [Acidimicrobiia bacterium]|nr:OmpA family protein [Acidimicrobiia bacterium]NNL96692.1 OmpA family protein [Acidimicrobiia bacterium]
MTRCFGLLGTGQPGDSKRVGLAVEGGVLHATEDGGASWNIPIERVALLGWAEDELHLELAGAEVSFLPEDRDATVTHLVPALLAMHTTSTAMPAAAGPSSPAPPAPVAPELIVDLTTRRDPVAVTPVAGRAGSAPRTRTPARVAPPVRRRRRLAWWVFVIAAMALGAFLATQLGRPDDPAAAARAAIADAGLPAVTVTVDDGAATLTGAIPSQDIADDIAAVVAGVAGVDSVASNLSVPTPPTTTIPIPQPNPGDLVRTALDAAGVAGVEATLEAGVVSLTGSVVSEFDRRAALAAIAGVAGIDGIDNQVTITARDDADIVASARSALDTGGFGAVSVSVEGGNATVVGAVPREVLGDGFFRYSDSVEDAVIRVAGITGITNRLQLAGDEATLRRQLRELTDGSPVVFPLGRADLSDTSRATLDAAAEIIQAQPGLRVLIAGHTDTTGSATRNEELSGQRAQAVRSYLIDQGIAANRLLVVAYGELFPTAPGAQPGDRRVEFEVAG